MTVSRKYDRHAKLVDRMASAVGVDLDEAQQRGNLPAQQVRDSVHTCLGCTRVEDCEHWLEGHGDGANATPGYCRNAKFFDDLKN